MPPPLDQRRRDGTMPAVQPCLACDLSAGRVPLPGGTIHETRHWRIEHCVGPLGLGTLIVKPKRHVVTVADLTEGEADELGPVLRDSSRVARDLVGADQVYNCLWSHAGGKPGHIHYVVQPVRHQDISSGTGLYGPALQVALFTSGQVPDTNDIATVADRARRAFRDLR